jgi:hypothetical protein
MQTENVELYFRQGSSDKVYHLQLENGEGRWSVRAQFGRRGSTLQSDAKASDVPYEEAKRVYDRILREKTAGLVCVSGELANHQPCGTTSCRPSTRSMTKLRRR